MNNAPSKKALHDALEIAVIAGKAIAAAGDKGLPCGHLYAAVMGGMDLETYQSLENFLIRQGVCTKSNDCLFATEAVR